MKLPEHTPVPAEALAAILTRHGLGDRALVVLPDTGIINRVYRLGDDLVLRVPRNHPAHAEQARREALAAPAARAAAVRTPGLVAFDDRLDLLPVPYLLVEWSDGVPLESLGREPSDTATAWRAVGRDLARLHHGADPTGPAGALPVGDGAPDPRELIERRASEGWFSPVEARWLSGWLDRLVQAAAPPAARRLVHADVQASNVMVGPDREYLALIDWGCAHWGDPVIDFIGMPLRAVPFVLAGHREVAPLDGDDGAEARVVWYHLRTALWLMPRGAAPGCSWGEQPTAMLLDLLRFFLEDPGERWRSVGPPRS
ncbi:MAG TPA: aminoglycoside phosphotransferase family protein [Chloroflexota bacterium]|nr:aminoglycoside phosphotransferase family protein [Chloroflexota bacterium]